MRFQRRNVSRRHLYALSADHAYRSVVDVSRACKTSEPDDRCLQYCSINILYYCQNTGFPRQNPKPNPNPNPNPNSNPNPNPRPAVRVSVTINVCNIATISVEAFGHLKSVHSTPAVDSPRITRTSHPQLVSRHLVTLSKCNLLPPFTRLSGVEAFAHLLSRHLLT